MGLLFGGCWSLQLMTSVNSATIFQREWTSPMHHNSELHKALGDETGKQQAAITPHTEGPEQRHQGEGSPEKHWLSQLSSCLAQQNNHNLHPHTRPRLPPQMWQATQEEPRASGSSRPLNFTGPVQIYGREAGRSSLSPLPVQDVLAGNDCPTVPQQSSGEPHAQSCKSPTQTPHRFTIAMCLYTSFSFSFHPSR